MLRIVLTGLVTAWLVSLMRLTFTRRVAMLPAAVRASRRRAS